MHVPPSKNDPILRFYKLCSKWEVDVDDNPDAAHEPNQWLKSDEMNNLLREMREKLDLESLSKGWFDSNSPVVVHALTNSLNIKKSSE